MFTFLGTSRIEGVTFNNCSQPITAKISGNLDMVDLYLINAQDTSGPGVIAIGGTVVATFSATTQGHVYTNSGANTIGVGDSASLTVTSGTFNNLGNGSYSGNGTIRAYGTSKLVLTNVIMTGINQPGVSGGDTADITLDHVTMDTLGPNAVLLRDGSTFTSKNQTHMAFTALASPRQACISTASTGTFNMSDTELTGCASGIQGNLPTNMTITNSTIHDNDGLALDVSNSATGNLTLTNTQLYNNGAISFFGVMRIQASILNVVFRGVNVHNNGGTTTGYYGMNFYGSAGSSYDFGTLASPGGNTFLGGSGGAALTIQAPLGLTIPAIGNTWTPSLQGADATGKYAVATGKVLEVIGPVTTPATANYHLATTDALDLAAIP
jgi:hypothetical protein